MEDQLKHVAIIMDGNGRWARERGRPRIWGHVRGSSIVSEVVEEADDLGIEALTLYTFSTENWSRPQHEIRILFALLKKYLIKERERIIRNKVQFRVMGDVSGLPAETVKLIEGLQNDTEDLNGLRLTFAFGYGGRNEIIHSINKFIQDYPNKLISEKDLGENLYIPSLPDVDLLIRTGGDKRISNFLLWQSAYAELFFTDSKWPDFTRKEFRGIIEDVSKRERRFGMIERTESLRKAELTAARNKSLLVENGLGH